MKFFKSNRMELEDLRKQVKELRERLEKVENAVDPIRIGKLEMRAFLWYPGWQDPRPTLSLRDAITKLMAHLKLDWVHVKSTPERIDVEKTK